MITFPKRIVEKMAESNQKMTESTVMTESSFVDNGPLKFLTQLSQEEHEVSQEFKALSLSVSSQRYTSLLDYVSVEYVNSSELALEREWDDDSELVALQLAQQNKCMRPEKVFGAGAADCKLDEIFGNSPSLYRRRGSSANWGCISAEVRK